MAKLCLGRRITRRSVLGAAAAAGSGLVLPRAFAQAAPAIVTAEAGRPKLPSGVMSGDVAGDRAVLWSRADRPSRMLVEIASNEAFKNARKIVGPAALPESDFTARVDVGDLPRGGQVFYRIASRTSPTASRRASR